MALRVAAAKALVELPSELVLPLAREWRSSRSWKFRRTAVEILKRHVTRSDIPWIRAQLQRRITNGHIYPFCDYAQMISMFPDDGLFVSLRRIFREFPYSYGRRFLAEAMAKTDPSFGSELAYPCLWDCEESVRLIGAKSIDPGVNGTRTRLAALAEDQWEDNEVRDVARVRLAA